jgi:3-oxoacyl-[acyl-carrier-protein] synthase II
VSAQVPIAVVGMSCRAPGVETPAELWDLLLAGDHRFVDVPPQRWPGLDPGRPDIAPRAALLDRIDEFDARFFGMAPRMAAWMDPQHRVLLELAWHAIEDAGLDPEQLAGEPAAVFAGCTMSDYRELLSAAGAADSAALPGALTAFLANRVSYQLGFTGPSMVIDSACSSGLSALALAMQGLRAGDYPMALVGATSVISNGYYANNAFRGGALSPSGTSVPFAAGRDGYLRGEGGACVLLKALPAAVADGDPVHGVLLAAGSAHNGRGGGLTGTDSDSQVRLTRTTLAAAGRAPRDLGYLEAHATGTPAGDAAEVAAVAEALTDADAAAGPEGRVWLGSVKANVGHLEAAAGLLGLVKTLLVLRHRRVPATPGLEVADPGLPVGTAPVSVAVRAVPWPDGDRPRLAAVNAFGLGGSLSQVVVEEAPRRHGEPDRPGEHVIPLSAGSAAALRTLADRLLRTLREDEPPTLSSVAWTLQSGRRSMDVRAALVAADPAGLRALLGELAAGRPVPAPPAGTPAAAWVAGTDVDWASGWAGPRPRRVSLPGSPFVRRSQWFDRSRPAG